MAALGLIETKGLLAAVEAADAMLKAADVRLLEKSLVGGGLVTITVAGEVSAVKAAVDAAVASVQRIQGGVLVSAHVIARPDEELARIIALQATPAGTGGAGGSGAASGAKSLAAQPTGTSQTAKPAAKSPVKPAGKPVAKSVNEPGMPVTTVESPTKSAAAPAAKPDRLDTARLKKMSLGELRRFAAGVAGISLSKEAVASADKGTLLKAILQAISS